MSSEITLNTLPSTDERNSESSPTRKCWSRISLPRRYLVAFLGFFGFLHVYLLRVNMSFAIVAMTANKSRIDENGTSYYVTISSINMLLIFNPIFI